MRSAHCPLRLGHCPLRQRIVRMPITPPQCGLSPERNAPPCCLLRAPRYCSQLSALSAPLSLCALSSALRSQRRFALSAPLSASPISRSPSRDLAAAAPPLSLALPRWRRRCLGLCCCLRGLAAVSITVSVSAAASPSLLLSLSLPLRPRRRCRYRCLCLCGLAVAVAAGAAPAPP